MKQYKVAIISSSVYSQHLALLAMGKSFEGRGCEVVVACNRSLQGSVEAHGLSFYALSLHGAAKMDCSPKSDHALTCNDRIQQLIDITKEGAIKTLMHQATVRTEAGAMPDGKQIIQDIAKMRDIEKPDIWVVEQNSVISRLALTALEEPFIAFCSSHPLTLPMPKGVHGVPSFWPKGMRPPKEDVRVVRKTAKGAHKRFTRRFNQLQRRFNKGLPKMEDALRHTSPIAVLFNYPNFGNIDNRHIDTHRIYLGASVVEETLSPMWRERLQQSPKSAPKILITFGTVFSERVDVTEACIKAARAEYPNAMIVAVAGSQKDKLKHLEGENIHIESCIPQRALIPHMDMVIHHGGVGTFTETLYFAKPMLVLPFAGDQFSVAYDTQYNHFGDVADPSNLNVEELRAKIKKVLETTDKWLLEFWSKRVRYAGPENALDQLRLFDDQKIFELKEAISA